MNPCPIVFLGTPVFAEGCLASLLNDSRFKVAGVVTQPDSPQGRKMKLVPSPVKQLALNHGLKVLSPKSVNTDEQLKAISEWNAEAAIVVAFGQIVSQSFLNLFPKKVINVHASLLPKLRGAAPIQRALMNGDDITGVCLQVMVRKLDAGDLIGSREVPITDDTDAISLHDQLKEKACELLSEELYSYLLGRIHPTPQDESLVTWAPKIEKAECQIDWNKSAREVFNHVRGVLLGPGAWCLYNGSRLKIFRTQVANDVRGEIPGEVLRVDQDSFVVSCGGQSALRIFRLQPESRGQLSATEFLKGYSLKVGDRLQ